MSELQDRLKKQALDIYHESDKCESKNDAMYTRRMLRKVCRENYRNDIASAIDKGRM